jgi:rubrerythrin
MEHLLKQAFLEAINIEKRSLTFYNKMAMLVVEQETRKIFELLAVDEAEHLDRLVDCFPGSKHDLLRVLNRPDNLHEDIYCECLKNTNEQLTALQALEISMHEENACIERYSCFVSSIRNPQIHEVFERVLEETRQHYEMISEEFNRVIDGGNGSKQKIFGSRAVQSNII